MSKTCGKAASIVKTCQQKAYLDMNFVAIFLLKAEGQNTFRHKTSMIDHWSLLQTTFFCLKSNKILIIFVLRSFTKKWGRWNARGNQERKLIQMTTGSDPSRIATKFNNFLANIGPSLASEVPSTQFSHKDCLAGHFADCFFLNPTSPTEVVSIVHSLKIANVRLLMVFLCLPSKKQLIY